DQRPGAPARLVRAPAAAPGAHHDAARRSPRAAARATWRGRRAARAPPVHGDARHPAPRARRDAHRPRRAGRATLGRGARSAALWARSRDLDALLLEAAPGPGGQLHRVHFEPRELPGLRAGAGPDLAAVYAAQLAEAGVHVRYGARAAALEPDGPAIVLDGGERIEAAAVLIVTGARRRRLDVPGERELEDRGVSYSATRDRDRLRDRTVA